VIVRGVRSFFEEMMFFNRGELDPVRLVANAKVNTAVTQKL